jgi:hypothetical protein
MNAHQLPVVDHDQVRRFLTIIHERAAAAFKGIARPGHLQLTRVHPAHDGITVSGRFLIGQVEETVAQALADAASGHNVYVEGRTVREGTKGRGTDADTVGVFAVVIDADVDKGRGGELLIPPSLSVESSAENAHHWYFLDRALPQHQAAEIGAALRACSGADSDTGNPVQPFRVAGTPNFPNAKKQARGRVAAPTAILAEGPTYSAETLAKAFGSAPRRDSSPPVAAAGIPASVDELLGRCSEKRRRDLAATGAEVGDRSAHIHRLVGWLKGDGFTLGEATALLAAFPTGAAVEKFGAHVAREVARSWGKVTDEPQAGADIAARLVAGKPASREKPVRQPKSAASLLARSFAPIRYIVPGTIAEGCTLLAGRPKLGKSWLCLEMAIAVATGGYCLGDTRCDAGDVLYLALEDNERRLQSRIKKLMPLLVAGPDLKRFDYDTEWPRANEGGIEAIRVWIKSKPDPRLVVVDVLAMFKPARGDKESMYEADYAAIKGLQALAGETGVAIVIVHHTRKTIGDVDPFEKVSGTLGLSGAADTVVILDRDQNGCTLYGRGRDIEEFERAVTFDRASCVWTAKGDAAEVRLTDERAVIVRTLSDNHEGFTPSELADAVGKPRNNIKQLLFKMCKSGEVVKGKRGRYYHPSLAPHDDGYRSRSETPDNLDNRDNRDEDRWEE